MSAVFADTFYWTALTTPGDGFYRKALEFSRRLRPERIITSDYVLIEYLAFFAKGGPGVRSQAAHLVSRLLQDSYVVVVPQSREYFLGDLSFTRAVPTRVIALPSMSMLIMLREGLTEILTYDRHFEQEGFRALFRD